MTLGLSYTGNTISVKRQGDKWSKEQLELLMGIATRRETGEPMQETIAAINTVDDNQLAGDVSCEPSKTCEHKTKKVRTKNHGKPWNIEQIDVLMELVKVKSSVDEIAKEMGRTKNSITSAFRRVVMRRIDPGLKLTLKEIKEKYAIVCTEILFY